MNPELLYQAHNKPQKPSHLLHLVLTIMTGGLWILIWILVQLVYEIHMMGWNRRMKHARREAVKFEKTNQLLASYKGGRDAR